MNYDQAREREIDGKHTGLWDWTTKNDGHIRVAPPCTSRCEHHSQEEAERHFYEYSLAQVVEYEDGQCQHKCAVCGAWTQKSLESTNLSLIRFGAFLCDEHRNRDELAKLHPFKTGIFLTHS